MRDWKRAGAFLTLCAAVSPAWSLTQPMPDWAQRFHFGGNADFRMEWGEDRAVYDRDSGMNIQQTTLTADIDVAPNFSFWADMFVIREGVNRTFPGEQLYLRWDNIANQSWLNAKLGHTFIPFGEDYLRWDSIDNPFNSMTTAFVWGEDNGVLLFGDILDNNKLSYAAAVQNGSISGFNYPDNPNKSITVKLMTDPVSWLHASQSFYNSGLRGQNTAAGGTELWLSGFHIQPLGANLSANNGASTGPVPPVGASRSNFVEVVAEESDLRAKGDIGELAANFGYMHIADGGGAALDRDIRYYSVEGIGYVPKMEKKAYLGARYSIVGTMNANNGYRFAGTEIAGSATNSNPYSEYNENQRDLYRETIVAGYHFYDNMLGKAEYNWEGSHLISQAQTPALNNLRNHRNYFIAALAIKF